MIIYAVRMIFFIGIDVKLRGENNSTPADRLSPLLIGTGRFDWVVHVHLGNDSHYLLPKCIYDMQPLVDKSWVFHRVHPASWVITYHASVMSQV